MTAENKEFVRQNISLEGEINDFFGELVEIAEKRRQELLEQLRTDSLQDPRNASCFRFNADGEILQRIKNSCDIDMRKASAQHSKAFGLGMKYAVANERGQFALMTCDVNGDLSYVRQDVVHVKLQGEDGSIQQAKVSTKKNDGVYDVIYETFHPGLYEIQVIVNGSQIKGSPFVCNAIKCDDINFRFKEEKCVVKHIKGEGKKILLEKNDINSAVKFYADVIVMPTAWKCRVKCACSKIKLKFGVCDRLMLSKEFSTNFYLQEIATPYKHYNQRNSRRQSTFQMTTLSFFIVIDMDENLIHVAVEGTHIEKWTSFQGNSQTLIPFIDVKHFCNIALCPRPTLHFT